MSQHAKDECPCCDDCWAHDYDRCGSDDCSCHGGPASERCGPCNGYLVFPATKSGAI